MAKNIDIAEMFSKGKREGTGNNMFIEGNTSYSYGKHFPMAIRLWQGDSFKFIWNNDKYSPTTSRHQSKVLRAIGKDNVIKEVNTQEMEYYKNFTEVKEVMVEALEDGSSKK